MIVVWLLLLFVAAALMALAHPFRLGHLEFEPNFINFFFASIGIALFMKVTSLRKRGRTRFILGFFTGTLYFSICLFWLVIALKEFGGLNIATSILVALVLASYCGIYFGVWSFVSGLRVVREKPLFLRILIWASAWASLECLREYLFTGFSWGELGYHFSAWPSLAPAASIWGVHGFTFFWIATVSVVLHADEWMKQKKERFQVITGFVLMIVFASSLVWFQNRDTEYEKIKLALIQPNIAQDLKWSSESASSHLNTLLRLTKKAVDENADLDLIVWPETSYPFLIAHNQKQMPFSSSIPLIFGGVVSDRRINKNVSILIEGDQIQQRYEKVHLVPFGEYVPFEEILPFEKLVENAGRFVAGSPEQDLLFHPKKNFKMASLICYEDIFSKHSVRQVRQGAQLLVNITNDAWYGRTSALPQHAAIAYMRFFQTGTPMIRSTNNGLTTIIDRNGRHRIPSHEENILVQELEIPTAAQQTLYVRFFPFTEWIWLLIFAIAIGWPMKMRTRKIFSNN